MSKQVKCINKTDRPSRHERISHIGGDWGKITESEAIRQIKIDTNAYHVNVGGYDVRVIIAVHLGREYLKTQSDSTLVDNLLSLPECL
jgi:uncharacterized protein DUF3892